MKPDYITPETAADQSPAQRNSERLNAKKVPGLRTEAELEIDPKSKEEELKKDPHAPKQNPAENEGNNYGKGAPEEQDPSKDADPRNEAPGRKDEQSQPDRDDQDKQEYHEETAPATPPEKTRETPQADPQA